jgi:hypothetical protein
MRAHRGRAPPGKRKRRPGQEAAPFENPSSNSAAESKSLRPRRQGPTRAELRAGVNLLAPWRPRSDVH